MRIKFKKSLMLTTLASLITISPLVTISACSSSSSWENSIIYELNKDLDRGWDANDVLDAVDLYDRSIANKSDTELVQTFIDFLSQINEANQVAYDGVDQIYTVNSNDATTPIYKPGKSGVDAFNFFVERTSKRVFPRIGNFFYDNWRYQIIGIHMDGMEYYYASIVPQFTYMKMVTIFNKLSDLGKLNEHIQNNNQFATALLTVYLDAINIFGADVPEFPPDANIGNFLTSLKTFINNYSGLPFTISNDDLNKQVSTIEFGLDKQTGWIQLTYYTTQPSTIKSK